jgi:hypothetical protein
MILSDEKKTKIIDEVSGSFGLRTDHIPEGAFTVQEFAQRTGLSFSWASQRLRESAKRGEIERGWDGRKFHYWPSNLQVTEAGA